jgi:hypothetical protein
VLTFIIAITSSSLLKVLTAEPTNTHQLSCTHQVTRWLLLLAKYLVYH